MGEEYKAGFLDLKFKVLCMISKWMYPVESWKMVCNSEKRFLAGEGKVMGVNKSTLESMGTKG